MRYVLLGGVLLYLNLVCVYEFNRVVVRQLLRDGGGRIVFAQGS